MFDEKTRAGVAGEPAAASATRSPAAARTLGRTLEELPPLLRVARAGDGARWPSRTPTCAASSASSATPRASSRRSPSRTPRCSPSMADTFEALGRDEQALKDTDRQVAVDARRGDRVVQGPAAVPRRPDRVLEGLLGRDRTSCAARCRRSTARSRSARRCSSACRRLNDELRKTLDTVRDVAEAARHQRRRCAA